MRQVVATYNYTDEAGTVLYRKLRYEPKDFAAQQPDGKGGWLWSLKGVRRVLYRLPDLMQPPLDRLVWIVEGEKDADALAALGRVATTNDGGAGKWLPELVGPLRGRHVVLIPDNDDQGRNHVRQVTACLRGVAASIAVIELPNLPPKGDVSDWLAAGGTVDDLLRLAEQATRQTGSTPSQRRENGGGRETVQEIVSRQLGAVESCSHDDLLGMELAEPSWLVEGLVADEGLTLLGGKKKLGKSWLCLQIAQAVALGMTCLQRPVVQGAVIYICLEDGRRRLKSRLLKQQTPAGLPITYYTRFPPLDGDGMGMLLDLLDREKPRLLILDTLAAAKTGKVDENASGPMADLGNALRALAQVYKAGVLATHHHGKLTGGDPGDDLRGSSALGAAGDVNLGLYREQAGHLIRGEGRDISEFTLGLSFDPEETWCWQLREDARARARDEGDAAVLEALHSLKEAEADAVASMVGRSRQKTADRLRRMANTGEVIARIGEADGRGRPRILFRIAVAEEPLPD